MLISTNFDSFAITYLKNFIFQQKKFHFPIEAVLNSLQTLKGLFTSQVIQWNVFLVLCLGIWGRHEIWKCRIV